MPLSITRLYFFVFADDHPCAGRFVSVHAKDADYAVHVMKERYNGEWAQMFTLEEWLLHRGEYANYTLLEEIEMPLNLLARVIGNHNKEIGLNAYEDGQPCYIEARLLMKSIVQEGWILVKQAVDPSKGEDCNGAFALGMVASMLTMLAA